MLRESVIYTPSAWKGLASKQYTKDFRRRQREGWQLVSCTESGRNWTGHTILTAIYERHEPSLLTPLIAEHLALLVPLLSEEERIRFYSEVQAVIHQWLARKAQR